MRPCTLRNRLLIAGIALCLIALTTPIVFAQVDRPAQPQATPSPSPSPEPSRGTDQPQGEDESRPRDPMSTATFNGLRFRSIGPAFTSGRVIGIAVDPNNSAKYYVAAASGGVWKTVNNGTTWTPVFDREGSYSIGAIPSCATIPPRPCRWWSGRRLK